MPESQNMIRTKRKHVIFPTLALSKSGSTVTYCNDYGSKCNTLNLSRLTVSTPNFQLVFRNTSLLYIPKAGLSIIFVENGAKFCYNKCKC